jgi:hypothetical protein
MGWDIRGALESGYDKLTGAEGAQAQEDFAKQTLKKQKAETRYAQGNVDEAALAGQGYLDKGQRSSVGALYRGQAGAMGDMEQARGAIGAAPSHLEQLYGGGLAAGFEADPGYQFRLQQGEQALNRAASAHGGRLGGAQLQALMAHGQGLASQEFNNYANRQIGMAGAADQYGMQRQSALAGLYGQSAGMQQNYGGNLASLFTNNANAKAGLGMNAAGMNAGLSQGLIGAMAGPTQYAGGASQARSNFLGGLVATAAGKGMDAAMAGG